MTSIDAQFANTAPKTQLSIANLAYGWTCGLTFITCFLGLFDTAFNNIFASLKASETQWFYSWTHSIYDAPNMVAAMRIDMPVSYFALVLIVAVVVSTVTYGVTNQVEKLFRR